MADKAQNYDQLKSELETIRKTGSLKQVSRIVQILRENQNHVVSKHAATLLANIKEPEMVGLMIDEIREVKNAVILKELVQACWESGLNYTDHLTFFTRIFIEADYETAIEVFTLIENTVLDFTPTPATKIELTDKIKAIILDLPEHKQNLAIELIHTLKP